MAGEIKSGYSPHPLLRSFIENLQKYYFLTITAMVQAQT